MSTYTFAQIKLPDAPVGIEVSGINYHDQITGNYTNATVGPNAGDPYPLGFIDINGKISYVPAIYGQHTSMGGINDKGWTVGSSGHYEDTARGFIHKGGSYTAINSSYDSFTRADGINNAGTVVGSFYNRPASHWDGYVLDKHGMTDISYPGATSTEARAINNLGNEIVGSYVSSDSVEHGFVDIAGIITALNVPTASSTEAKGVNNFGIVVGDFVGADLRSHGFLYDPATKNFAELDVPGSSSTNINAINDLGDVAGNYQTGAPGNNMYAFIATVGGHQPPIGTVLGHGSEVLLGPASQNIAYGGGTLGFGGGSVLNPDLAHTAAMNILVPQPTT